MSRAMEAASPQPIPFLEKVLLDVKVSSMNDTVRRKKSLSVLFVVCFCKYGNLSIII